MGPSAQLAPPPPPVLGLWALSSAQDLGGANTGRTTTQVPVQGFGEAKIVCTQPLGPHCRALAEQTPVKRDKLLAAHH